MIQAIVYEAYGSPDVLELREIEKPTPSAEEVLIKVHAASVNSWDWVLLRGAPVFNRMTGPMRPRYEILGCDVAGLVEAVGNKVKRLRPGDAVFGDLSGCRWGGFAEYVCGCEDVLAVWTLPLGQGLDWDRARRRAQSTAVMKPETPLTNAHTPAFSLESGPIEEVHAFWLAGMSCDGCSIAAVGAQSPSVEQLINADIPGLPRVVLHHPVLAVEAGERFMEPYRKARRGELGAPYVVVYEGSVADERIAGHFGGYWSAMGAEDRGDGVRQPYPTAKLLRDLSAGAAAVIAVGTCATWGGVPAALGNVTDSMATMDYLGQDYRSALGLPVINIPGCAPIGDNITETVAAVLMFLAGVGPLPEFDELGRPAWMFKATVHQGCERAGHYEEGVFAEEYGDRECLVELGCWGPVVQCNMVSRGAVGHSGGCMNTGGICIGCTMPGFPDAFAPFYTAPPGQAVSGMASRLVGSFIRPLRRITQRKANLTRRWAASGHVPSGWGHVPRRGPLTRVAQFFYQKLQSRGTRFRAGGGARQRRLQAGANSYIIEAKEQVRRAAKEGGEA